MSGGTTWNLLTCEIKYYRKTFPNTPATLCTSPLLLSMFQTPIVSSRVWSSFWHLIPQHFELNITLRRFHTLRETDEIMRERGILCSCRVCDSVPRQSLGWPSWSSVPQSCLPFCCCPVWRLPQWHRARYSAAWKNGRF